MAYPPKAKAVLERRHQFEHREILAAMSAAAFANSGLNETEIARGSVTLALEIQKAVAEQFKS